MRKLNVKKCKKLFTKSKSNNIMRNKYIFSKANRCEREGLVMKEANDIILDEIEEKLNFIEMIFLKKKYIRIYKEGIKRGFNWSNFNVR